MKAVLHWLKDHARRLLAGPSTARLAHLEARATAAEARAVAADARLSRLIGQSPDGLWEWECAAGQWYFSPRFRELAGYADEDEFRREFDFRKALHGDDQARVMAIWQQALMNGQPCRSTFRMRCRHGYRWFMACATPDADQCRLTGSLSDHAEHRALELAVSEHRQHLDTLALSAQDGIWQWQTGENGETHDYSPRYAALLGYAPGELPPGRGAFLDLLHEDERPRVEAALARLLQEDVPFDCEHRLRCREGDWLWVRNRARASRADEDRRVTRVVGTCCDISRERQARDSLHQLLVEKRALEDNAVAGILYLRGSIITGCNPVLLEQLGYVAGDLIGKPLAVLVRSPQEAERLNLEARARLARGQRYVRETDLLHKDGSPLWCLLSASAPSAADAEERLVWMFTDLSRQKRTVDALRLERDFSNALISHLPGVFCLLDGEGRLIRWNANFERQTGFSAREILRLHWDGCVAEEQCRDAKALVDEALRDGSASALLGLRNTAGRTSPHHITCVSVAMDDAPHVALLGLDMTEQQRAARQVRELNAELEDRVKRRTEELQAANRELESFSYSVSHDLTTPLRGIDGFSRILEEDYGAILDATARGHLQRIRAGTSKMQQLIDDLLQLSRISREEIRHEPVDLARLSRDILREFRLAEPQRRVETLVSPQVIVRGDNNLLRIALDNLLRNAWKFTSGNEIANIEFGILHKDGQRVYFVRDDGAGFDMRYASRLFRAFERLHRTSEFEGTGVGLAIVSRIIHRHGGSIWAESTVNKGAAFYFTLP